MVRPASKRQNRALSVELGRLIKEGRERVGISQSELARRIDAPPVTISNAESGKDRPGLERLSRIGRIIDVDLVRIASELMRQDPDKYETPEGES